MATNKIIILVGPSGVGKGSIGNLLLHDFPSIKTSISLTSRPMRPGDVEGKNYYFVSREEFERKIDNGELLEHAIFAGNRYGTLKSEIEKPGIILAELEVSGASFIKEHFPDNSLAIFIAPPSIEVLIERLRSRGTESDDAIEKRINTALFELTQKDMYDKLIINDDLHVAYQEVRHAVESFIKNDA